MRKIAVYPGTFDPITNGHINLVQRGLNIFDELIIAVAKKTPKETLFSIEERVEMIKTALKDFSQVKITSFDGLLVDYLKKTNVNVILRGLRAVLDFEYEFQMALMNRKLDRNIETIFMMTGYQWFYVSSRIIKEVVMAGGSVEGLVPDIVNKKIKGKFYEYKIGR
ncbi:MAG: pantetheine-phosphate adenylyltransferase [Thermodesulfobacteriota bacterium]|nr:pantetheine-phosphate adenylyltransferase [Thermodesulfobacteriota bacterium]